MPLSQLNSPSLTDRSTLFICKVGRTICRYQLKINYFYSTAPKAVLNFWYRTRKE